MKVVEWIGALAGIAGSLVIALAYSPALGFGAYAVSNVAWIVSAWRRGMRAMLLQQLVFTATTLIGLWTWWLAPMWRG